MSTLWFCSKLFSNHELAVARETKRRRSSLVSLHLHGGERRHGRRQRVRQPLHDGLQRDLPLLLVLKRWLLPRKRAHLSKCHPVEK